MKYKRSYITFVRTKKESRLSRVVAQCIEPRMDSMVGMYINLEYNDNLLFILLPFCMKKDKM